MNGVPRSGRSVFALLAGVMVLAAFVPVSCTQPGDNDNDNDNGISPAVLAGDWETTDADGARAVVRFNEEGVVEAILGENAEGMEVLILIDEATTEIEGDQVTITIPTPAGARGFIGTLSEDQNTLEGTVGEAIEVSGTITVIIPQGEVTLTRIIDGGGNDNDNDNDNGVTGPAETFPTSLHFTRVGKANFYSATYGGEGNEGFEAITDVPYSELTCKDCHPADGLLADNETPVPDPYVPTCGDCHVDPENPAANPVTDDTCYGCHGRQNAEANALMISDVHRDAGMGCADCHSLREMHGDGNEYDSLLEPGAMDTRCENCHSDVPSNTSHLIHADSGLLDCSACHVQSVITCNSCHFETEVAGAGKRFFPPPASGFVFLINRDFDGDGQTKVTTASYQSLTWEGQTFYTMAPYYAHTVTAEARGCSDCHNNSAVTEYNETGQIVVNSYDEDSGTLVTRQGVIPIPPDWRTALQMDFMTYTGDPADPTTDPDAWEFLKTGADATQMLFGEPLTEDQMNSLSN